MKLGLGLSLTGLQRRRAAQIITAVIAPALGPLTDGDTIASALSADIDETSNYASTAGTISTVDVVITVNGDPALASDTVDAGDVVVVTVTVTDSEANERVFNAGTRTVAGIAPANDVAPAIAGDTGLGDTLTVTAGSWSGAPAPTLTYQWLRGGVEIVGETGTTYDITLADSGALITVRETATNAEGSASAVSNAITADVFTVPDAFTAPDWDVANDGDTVSVNIITLPADGGAPITDIEYRVNGGTAVSLGETTTGSYPITADEGDDIEIRAVNAIGPTDPEDGWSDVKAVPEASTGLPDLAYDVLLEAYDPASLFSDTAGTTAASVDGAVARVSDTSGNSNHATQATVAARPLRRQSGDLNWLDLDGVDDNLVIASDASWVKNGMSLVSVFRAPVSMDRLVLLGNAGASGTAAVGYMQDGVTSVASSAILGALDYYTNGAFTGTDINRAQAYAAWVTGEWIIAEVANMSLVGSDIASQGAQFPGWRQRTQELGPAGWGAQILIPTAILDTGTNRADLVAGLANIFGITL